MKQLHPKYIFYFLTCLALLTPGLLPAQSQKPKEVHIVYDSTAIPELFNTVAIGFTFTWPDGHKTSTRGLLNGRIRWKKLTIQTSQGKVDKGQLTFDPEKVWQNGHKLTFHISIADTTLYCKLALPYVQQVQFNLYTDSLKRDIPFYLNVEGHFSSGRIYPLDTQQVRFKASGGSLENNVLLVKKTDTSIHRVKIHTWVKADPELKDCVWVPVKVIPDTARLPSEKELLQKWKKR